MEKIIQEERQEVKKKRPKTWHVENLIKGEKQRDPWS